MSTESTFVVNVKTRIGTIVTVRGDDYDTLQVNILKAIEGGVDKTISALEEAVIGEGAQVAYATKALGATVVGSTNSFAPVPPASSGGAPAPSCPHGAMVHRSGSGAKGPWQAWMCSLPKERKEEQCDPQWIRKGQPGWI
jgi:hypothetical protein